jgi:DUF971 family protein
MTGMSASAWPQEIRLAADKKALIIRFEDGVSASLPAEMLRVLSPSAEVQGHAPDQRKTIPGKRNVMILAVEPMGNYAIRLRFDDLHETGIFSWALLHDFASNQESLFNAYLEELAAKGLSRDR